MSYTQFCKEGCGRVLTIQQMKTTGICDNCGRKHAADFHKKYDIKQDTNKEVQK